MLRTVTSRNFIGSARRFCSSSTFFEVVSARVAVTFTSEISILVLATSVRRFVQMIVAVMSVPAIVAVMPASQTMKANRSRFSAVKMVGGVSASL
jgi:hypothetical protein